VLYRQKALPAGGSVLPFSFVIRRFFQGLFEKTRKKSGNEFSLENFPAKEFRHTGTGDQEQDGCPDLEVITGKIDNRHKYDPGHDRRYLPGFFLRNSVHGFCGLMV
jgi:hypothetical protein